MWQYFKSGTRKILSKELCEEAVDDSLFSERVVWIGLGDHNLLFLLCALFY